MRWQKGYLRPYYRRPAEQGGILWEGDATGSDAYIAVQVGDEILTKKQVSAEPGALL